MSISEIEDWLGNHIRIMDKKSNRSNVKNQLDVEKEIRKNKKITVEPDTFNTINTTINGLYGLTTAALGLGSFSAIPMGINLRNIDTSGFKNTDSDRNIDTLQKATGVTRQNSIDEYDEFMNAASYLDDILYGLPSGDTIGTNYYKQIEKCQIEEEGGGEEVQEGSNPPWKHMYIRTKPIGNALYRLGIGGEDSRDNGLIFSLIEDIIDLDPFRISRMFSDNDNDDDNDKQEDSKYKNCSSKLRNQDPNIKYFDKYNNEIPAPTGEYIEMFETGKDIKDIKDIKYSKNKYYAYILTTIFIILIIIVLYKLIIL